MQRFSVALLALILAATAQGDWSVVSSTSETTNGGRVEHRHIAAQTPDHEEATVDLAIFSTKTATLRVIDNPTETRADLAGTMQRERCLAGVNGGYFDPQDAPVGLMIADGRMLAPLSRAQLLSGIVSVVAGRVAVQRPSEFSLKSKPIAARQCGPFLVNSGRPIAGLNVSRGARRTFVATSNGDRAAIGYCSYVTLAQLGALLASPALGDFRTARALNLDGGSSSGFWFAGEKGVFSIAEQKDVRDYIAIVPK